LLRHLKIRMGRILAIDYGKKRVGLAVSDPQQIIAGKLDTVATHTIWDFLQEYFNKEQVDEVVVGYPRKLNNTASEAVVYINPFLKKFKMNYPDLKLELVDERFTSRMASMAMLEGGMKKKDRRNKEIVDAISATILLQSYMEQKRNKL
jgi:putative holliday junction resolvase